jgi:hypothetical protein
MPRTDRYRPLYVSFFVELDNFFFKPFGKIHVVVSRRIDFRTIQS